MITVKQATPRQVRFWTITLILTWGSLAALLALRLAGVL